jgi:NMT1/THI5 like
MPKFVISPHFRLQEWVAEEKGYFRDEGLDYVFREVFKTHATPDKVGAYTSFEEGRETNVSCACHWTVNVAASKGMGKMVADCYSVSPGGVFVAPESPIREPKDLKGVPISVGHQSGSHYSTLQALEQYLPRADIKLSFADGILFGRMEKLIDRQVPAAALFSGPYYFLEQLGFRKIIDTTFMMAAMLTGEPDPEDVRKYFRALRRRDRHAALGPGRAHRVRALHARGVRGVLQVDRRARDLRARHDGRRALRRGLRLASGACGRTYGRVARLLQPAART